MLNATFSVIFKHCVKGGDEGSFGSFDAEKVDDGKPILKRDFWKKKKNSRWLVRIEASLILA